MANYVGRLTQQPEVANFLGINSKSSIVSGVSGEAVDIDNWDIDLSGAITRRQGYEIQYNFGADIVHLDSFFKLDGTQVYVVVANGNLWEATSPAGPWTNRGGTLTTGDFTYIGADINGVYMLCNGVDQPIIFTPGSAVQTLEAASQIGPPASIAVTPTNGTGVAWQYAVSSVTPRGESLPSNPGTTLNGPATLTLTAYNTLSWVPVVGAFTQYVYRYNATDNAFHRIAILQGTATSFVDNGAIEDPFAYPVLSAGSINTPADWDTNGQPEGCFVLARGKNQRMMAWRKNQVFVSALSNVYDWYTANDSFAFAVLGGQDNNVKAVAVLFDYTLIFSQTNLFVYTGSNYLDFSLSKILSSGCASHYSIAHVGDDLFIWSQFGPTKVSRVLSGADVETNPIGAKISPIVFGQTNLTHWDRIRGWHDLLRQRLLWCLPSLGTDIPNTVLAYNYQTKGWTKFSGWRIGNVTFDPRTKLNYAHLDSSTLVLLHSGNTDGGLAIPNLYTSIYSDTRTYLKKRAVFLDILMDSSSFYELDVTLNLDFGSTGGEVHHLSFSASGAFTDGESIVLEGSQVNTHRIVVFGYARQFQYLFKDTENSTPAKVFGWRLDQRAYGVR